MKKHVGALSTLALLAVSLPNLFAQGNQPSQTRRSNGASSGNPGPCYSADLSDIGSQSSSQTGRM